MSYIPTELDNNLNWDLVLRGSYERRLYDSQSGVYAPIPDIAVGVGSPLLLVGTKCTNAPPHWFLGCRASLRLQISPSSTSEFMAGAEIKRFNCGLERLTLVQFPLLRPMPYILVLSPANWLPEIFIEVWRYSGAILEDSELHTPDILQTVNRIERKIDISNT